MNNCATNLYWTKLNASHDHQNDKRFGNGNTKTDFTMSNNFQIRRQFQFVTLLHLTHTLNRWYDLSLPWCSRCIKSIDFILNFIQTISLKFGYIFIWIFWGLSFDCFKIHRQFTNFPCISCCFCCFHSSTVWSWFMHFHFADLVNFIII